MFKRRNETESRPRQQSIDWLLVNYMEAARRYTNSKSNPRYNKIPGGIPTVHFSQSMHFHSATHQSSTRPDTCKSLGQSLGSPPECRPSVTSFIPLWRQSCCPTRSFSPRLYLNPHAPYLVRLGILACCVAHSQAVPQPVHPFAALSPPLTRGEVVPILHSEQALFVLSVASAVPSARA